MNITSTNQKRHKVILQELARRAMIDRGLLPDYSPAALAQLDGIQSPAAPESSAIRDLTGLLWASIDNDDSRDLDQLTVAELRPGDAIRILVAIADVDALVKKGTAIDDHARHNTTSVYTSALVFPMLPEKLSTGLTSLNFQSDRLALVIEMVVAPDGSLRDALIYPGRVRNKAKLAYKSVGAWLEGQGATPEAVAAVAGLAAQ